MNEHMHTAYPNYFPAMPLAVVLGLVAFAAAFGGVASAFCIHRRHSRRSQGTVVKVAVRAPARAGH